MLLGFPLGGQAILAGHDNFEGGSDGQGVPRVPLTPLIAAVGGEPDFAGLTLMARRKAGSEPEPAAVPEDVVLLGEIRDLLRAR
jgi:hypothetical protein